MHVTPFEGLVFGQIVPVILSRTQRAHWAGNFCGVSQIGNQGVLDRICSVRTWKSPAGAGPSGGRRASHTAAVPR